MADIMFASTNLWSYTLHHCGKGGGGGWGGEEGEEGEEGEGNGFSGNLCV